MACAAKDRGNQGDDGHPAGDPGYRQKITGQILQNLFLRFPRRLVTFDSLDILTGESCRYKFLVFHCHSRLL